MGLNTWHGIGNLGRDPETRYTTSGDMVVNFSLAINETWKDRNGNRQERTEWFNCTAWRHHADFAAAYLKKGALVYVEGAMKSRKYTPGDGVERTVWDVQIRKLESLGRRPDDPAPEGNPQGQYAEGAASAPGTAGDVDPGAYVEDDIPF